ncbi:hypothetical protein GCM10028773_12510 [Spirosoma koreense]
MASKHPVSYKGYHNGQMKTKGGYGRPGNGGFIRMGYPDPYEEAEEGNDDKKRQ